MKLPLSINKFLLSACIISSGPAYSSFEDLNSVQVEIKAYITTETCTAIIGEVADLDISGDVEAHLIPRTIGEGYPLPNFDGEIKFLCKDGAKYAKVSLSTLNALENHLSEANRKLFTATGNSTVALGFDLVNNQTTYKATPGVIYNWALNEGVGSIKFKDAKLFRSGKKDVIGGNAKWDFTFTIWNS
ncbi:hypothetical protein [Aeromonas veronii]|uniref:hypothetical protein n=1 Tax=Aeromonas veronii TaxID=654 RepID=UPI002B498A79|nr:hypothetical protein [Aeromonas veronii]